MMSKIKSIACTFTAFQTKLESGDMYPLNLLSRPEIKIIFKKTGTARDYMGLVL